MKLQTKQVYSLGSGNSFCHGIQITDRNIDEYFSNRVRKRSYDVEGTDGLVQEFSDVANTGFEINELENTFSSSPSAEPWKIGEAFSECYLEDHNNIRFPYSNSRDLKNPKSGLAGADLVGFFYDDDVTLFLFGEVKTSSEKKYPPRVVSGRSGLRQQLEGIKSCRSIRNFLVMWLGFKIQHLDDSNQDKLDYKNALRTYLTTNQQIKDIGVLIRDVIPKKSDLESRFNALKTNLHPKMQLELLALYFSFPASTFVDKVGGQ